MRYHFEATTAFTNNIQEVQKLLELASADDMNRNLFLKLSIVSLVTKFQVFIEEILTEFRQNILGKQSNALSVYIKMNSLRISLDSGNPLMGLQKHKNFTEEKRNNIEQFLKSISYITDNEYIINNDFRINTKFPLGKTGKKELIDLLKQIDGCENPFYEFGIDEFRKIDSILQTRHSIVHQDRFNGSDVTVNENIEFINKLVLYIDNYLFSKQ